MCGYLGNVIDSPLSQLLMQLLEIDIGQQPLRNNPGAGPAASIDIILEQGGQRIVSPAIWWLLLEDSAQGLKPSRYTSFNTRWDKLNTPRSAGFRAFRESRCVIPATFIIEGEGPKGHRRYHRIAPTTTAFALAGLYREWQHSRSGQRLRSCSVITLPPHPAWRAIHSKSTPLFLPNTPSILDDWLSPAIRQIEIFEALLQPSFPGPLQCLPVERPGNPRPVGEVFIL